MKKSTGAADRPADDLGVGIAYVVAILVGLVFPTAAVLLYLALGVLLVVPFQHLRRMLFSPD